MFVMESVVPLTRTPDWDEPPRADCPTPAPVMTTTKTASVAMTPRRQLLPRFIETPFLLLLFYGPNAGTVPTSRAEVELPLLHTLAPPFGSKTAPQPKEAQLGRRYPNRGRRRA